MSVQIILEPTGLGEVRPALLAEHLARVDQAIEEAGHRLEERERGIAQAAVAGQNTAHDEYDLQKMQLLLAILREGRERLRGRLPTSS